jgi:hypothetical protein
MYLSTSAMLDDIKAGSPLSNSATFLMTSTKESFEARLCSFSRVMMLTASLAVFSTGSHQGAYCFTGCRSLYLEYMPNVGLSVVQAEIDKNCSPEKGIEGFN